MKKLGIIASWILISLLFQFGILIYLDRFYLEDSDLTYSEETVDEKTVVVVPEEFKIPAAAKNIRVSFNGAYASYIEDDTLVVIDVKERKQISALRHEGFISFYRWLPDRNRIIIMYKQVLDKKADFSIFAYDVDSLRENEIEDIEGLAADCEVDAIELSTFTNVLYIKLRVNEKTTQLYRMNIMDHIRRVYPRVVNITRMHECSMKDIILYEDSNKNVIYVQEGTESWTLKIKKKLVLLGVDSKDAIYAGELEDGLVRAIYKGLLDTSAKKWERTELEDTFKPEDFLLTYSGEEFYKNSGSSIKRLSDGRIFEYRGEFLELLDGYIVSLYDGYFVLTPH